MPERGRPDHSACEPGSPGQSSPTRNLQRILAAIDGAAATQPAPDLLVLPGACDFGGAMPVKGYPVAMVQNVREAIAHKAREWGVYIAAGLHMRGGDGFQHAAVLFDPDGDVVAVDMEDEPGEGGSPWVGSRWSCTVGDVEVRAVRGVVVFDSPGGDARSTSGGDARSTSGEDKRSLALAARREDVRTTASVGHVPPRGLLLVVPLRCGADAIPGRTGAYWAIVRASGGDARTTSGRGARTSSAVSTGVRGKGRLRGSASLGPTRIVDPSGKVVRAAQPGVADVVFCEVEIRPATPEERAADVMAETSE